MIGVNKYVDPDEKFDIELHPLRPDDRRRARSNACTACAASATTRRSRALLDQLVDVAKDETQNIMPVTIELVAAGATMGDIVEKLKTLWGTYRENAGVLTPLRERAADQEPPCPVRRFRRRRSSRAS